MRIPPGGGRAAMVAWLLLLACNSPADSRPPQPVISVIDVAPVADTLTVFGQGRQFSAVARDSSGAPIAGVGFIWASSNPAVATLVGAGLVSAIGNGTARISASASGVRGEAEIVVSRRAVRLTFLDQPGTQEGQEPIQPAIRIAIEDATGAVVTAESPYVSLGLAPNAAAATLLGPVAVRAVDGIATFPGLSIALPGDSFSLDATSAGLAPAASNRFAVRLTFVQEAPGGSHSCGLTAPGFAYCWGINVYGQLGDGTSDTHLTPRPVAGRLRFGQLSAGAGHNCGITATGDGYCWGDNPHGELGDGSNTSRSRPARIIGGLRFIQLSAGNQYSCGVTAGNAAYCWGENVAGRLGDGSSSDRWTPTPVAGGLSIALISAGGYHACGVTTANAAWCWGLNTLGQVGDGTTDQRSTPVPVAGGLALLQVSVGFEHTCALTVQGTGYCWGSNAEGQLGDGTRESRALPVPVAGGLLLADLSARTSHTCATSTARIAYCWGSNLLGRLGVGDSTASGDTVPTPVAGGLLFIRVRAGDSHSCGIAVARIAWCWGANDFGRLGDGTTSYSFSPRTVVH